MASVKNGIALGPNSPLRSTSKKLRLGFSESQMQCAAVKLLVGDRGRTSWGMAESRRWLRLLYAIPNQRIGKAQGGKMRGEGQLPGMPDLCLPAVRYIAVRCIEELFEPVALGALYIEVKLEGEKPRKTQQEVIDALREDNAVVVCRSVESIVHCCKVWGDGSADQIDAMLKQYRA